MATCPPYQGVMIKTRYMHYRYQNFTFTGLKTTYQGDRTLSVIFVPCWLFSENSDKLFIKFHVYMLLHASL